ncbi:hypothetical protein F5B19DRAFT_262150 [Rostrohypoxylon terebratum]|nr:hypothetical protein F5B19DRAFT_262150 [Rostrohypoxylon terebratum]
MATIHVFRTAETERVSKARHGTFEEAFASLKDSGLSEKGLKQCQEFSDHSKFFSTLDHVTHIVSSPLHSSIYSCRIALDRVVSGKSIIPRPELMDTGILTPVFGTDYATLYGQFAGLADLSALSEGWESVGPDSSLAHDVEKIKARTTAGRKWLMDLARDAGENTHIVVMTHGKTAHFLTDDFQGTGSPKNRDWDGDLSWRSYKFDFDAGKMVETSESLARRGASALPEEENESAKAEIEAQIKRNSAHTQRFQALALQIFDERKTEAEQELSEGMGTLSLSSDNQ